MSRTPWGQPRHPAIRTRSNDQAGPPQAGGPARSILGGGITCENGLSMAKYPLAEDRKGEVGAFWATVFAGIWLLLQGLSGFVWGSTQSVYRRQPGRWPCWAFLPGSCSGRSCLPCQRVAPLEGPRHCLRARTGGVPADRQHSQPFSAPVERISPPPFPALPC